MPTTPQFITATEARSLFRKYHGFADNDPDPKMADSRGPLEVLVEDKMEKLSCTMLSPQMINELTSLVQPSAFAGIAAFPAMQADNSFTMIFAALEWDGTGTKLVLPDTFYQATHIYDHVRQCPSVCPTNIALTLGDWKH